jgi:hypothetical protein
MTRFALRRAAVTVLSVAVIGGCSTPTESNEPAAQGETTSPTTVATEAAAKPPAAACPLVDTSLLPTLFKVTAPKLEEKGPVKRAGGVTVFACDVSDGGELFLTVGVSVGPPSGSAEANVSAALEGVTGEPVAGVGEAGAFGAEDGVGTVAGMKTVGGKAVLLFVYGDADSKSELVSVAKSASSRF